MTYKLIPKRMVSYGLVGISGVAIQLLITSVLTSNLIMKFEEALPISVATSATWNYLINNLVTFHSRKLVGTQLIRGLVKFLMIASVTVVGNIVIATWIYKFIYRSEFFAQIASILIVFTWNYLASSHFIWKKK